MCNPELYRIRELLYGHIQAIASPLSEGSSQSAELPKYNTEITARLIQVFDNVLQEEYCREHELLPLIHQAEESPVCGFCNGDLFLSVFRCLGGCGTEGLSNLQTFAVMVCPACFVEGRTCACGKMAPSRLQGFLAVLEQRNLAAATVRRLQGSAGEVPADDFNELYER